MTKVKQTTLDARDTLVEDFKKVIHNTEELIKATANQTGEKVDEVRERAEENLRAARQKLGEIEDTILDRTKAAAKATDQLVHAKPWQSITIATAVGVMLGMLISRR